MRFRRKRIALAVLIPVAIGLVIIGGYFYTHREPAAPRETTARPKPEAPPDLENLRASFMAGVDAVNRRDGSEGVKQLAGFTFKQRAVEEYRLWYLARAHELAGNADAARTTLALLWQRAPKMAARDEAGQKLGVLYANRADFRRAANVYSDLATSSDPKNSATARWSYIESRFAQGDVASMLFAARNIAIKSPKATETGAAVAVVRALSGLAPNQSLRLTTDERLERAVGLLRDYDAQDALDELTALEANALPAHLVQPVRLNRGLALSSLRRYEDSNRVLDPLASGSYRVAIPAIYTASKNYRALAASINPIVIKTVTERKQIGTVKVRTGKGKKSRLVSKPKFGNVKRNVQLVDLAKKAKKDTYERLAVERLKDLLALPPLAEEVRIEVLNTLVGIAEAKNQTGYEQELVAQLVKIDPSSEAWLQRFWDKAWAAYARGDLNGARPLFKFIADTYRNPNIRRQSQYWFARSSERLGNKEEAAAIYRQLASAPYDDLYAIYSEQHGAPRPSRSSNPLKEPRPDWGEIAEKSMPPELRLGYELTALSDARDAQIEIRQNANRKNQQFSDALLAELYSSANNLQMMYTSLRRAWPTLATVEQDSVPPHFLKLYYPMKYEESIRKNAEKNGLDPYLIMALILQESYFNPNAKSVVGATGLMQLMPATGKELAQKLHTSAHLENPDTNIRLGTYHFRHLVDLFDGKVQLAVASYNAGQGNVQKWRRAAPSKPMDDFLESIPFPETRNYVKRVTLISSAYRRFNS
ncbi:MAG: soluble lytic murein transglycosylase [Acidobacteriota bacterium]|jgi:soluble lytic murein transglycosylase-like protein|nr:soluble lytic murein transglycosylase [Acidobacteriota bacterium]